MDLLAHLPTSLPALIAAPAWFESLDGANLVIGFLMLVVGLLGMGYLAMVLLTTPQPQTEPAAPVAYPSVDRFLVPLLLPIGVALAIAAIILLMSQILLVVPESIATSIALLVAILILLLCSMVANAPRISRSQIYTVIGVPLLVLIVAGSAAGIYRVNQTQQEAAAEAAKEANAPATSLGETTTDDKYSKTSFNVPAGQAITLTQTNDGSAIHNWHVLDAKDDSGSTITTQLTQPGQKSTVTFTISAPGTYHFQCDVHPTEMTGTITVQAAS